MGSNVDKLIEKLERLLVKSDIPWWEWNIKENIVRFNPLKVTMLGYSIEDFKDAGYQAFTSLLHPEDYERTMNAMRDYLSGKAPIYQIDYRIKDAEGKWHWYLDRGAAVEKDSFGNPLVLRGIVLDMGEYFTRADLENRLKEIFRKSGNASDAMMQNFIVICSNCRKTSVSKDTWEEVDENFSEDGGMHISHSICPECVKLLYPDLASMLCS